MNISPVTQSFYSYKNKQNQSSISFEGKWSLMRNPLFSKIENRVEIGCAKLMGTEPAKGVTKFLNKHTDKNPNLLSTHFIILGSTLLSGFYILKTLNNKKLEEKERKTLAVNQTLVYGVSTALAYAFEGWAMGKIDKVADKFVDLNKDADPSILKKLYPHNDKIQKATAEEIVKLYSDQLGIWKSGFNLAKSIMIVSLIYRFIAPVIMTPIANAIGNKFIHKDGSNKTLEKKA